MQAHSAPPPITIIVIDDDLSIRRALMMQLRVAGFRVRAFRNANAIFEMTQLGDNVCLLLDIYMAGLGEAELIRKVADVRRRVPVVLMTGRDDEQTRKLVSTISGPPPCLFKPFEQTALLRAIEKAMRAVRTAPR